MASQSTTSKPGNAFETALKQFQRRLTPEERKQFQVTSLDELKSEILAIQSEQRDRKKQMHLSRIQRFLEAMEQFGKVIEVFVNTNETLAFVWGPIKLLLLTAKGGADAFDCLLDAYSKIADSLPIFQNYQHIFQSDPEVQVGLSSIWENILDFHTKAIRIFSKSTVKLMFRSLWNDFKSRFGALLSDLEQKRLWLESYVNQIHIQHSEHDRIAFLEEIDEQRRMRASEKLLAVHQWLQAPSCIRDHEEHQEVRDTHHKATKQQAGLWLLDNDNVKTWMSTPFPRTPFLWIHAKPGAGKSVLSSIIIDEIQDKKRGLVAFFYCKDQDLERRSFASIVRALLLQLIDQQRDLIPYYYDMRDRTGEIHLHSEKLTKQLFQELLQTGPKTFLVLDGLDECPDKDRAKLMDLLIETISLSENKDPGKIRLLLVSRAEPDIKKRMSSVLVEDMELDYDDLMVDIGRYIEHRADLVLVKFSPAGLTKADRDLIAPYVLARTDGMFLFAKLVMENLQGQPSLERLREELDPRCFPDKLDQAYGRTLERIRRNPNKNEAEEARRILSLMICSIRPLRWREVQAAISLNLAEQAVQFSRCPVLHIKEICGSLITILKDGDRIEFVHATAVHYITNQSNYIERFSSERSMAMLCLQYLVFECFTPECEEAERARFASAGYYAFQDYAIAHWADHVLSFLGFTAPKSDSITEHPTSSQETFDIDDVLLSFAGRFDHDGQLLASLVADKKQLASSAYPPGLGRFKQDQLFLNMYSIWYHAKCIRAFIGDKQEQTHPERLRDGLASSRQTLENMWVASPGPPPEMREVYGPHWFKCSRTTCYYFHEGFDSESSRKQHYDRHDLPFRCDDQNGCAGAITGFASQKELMKHNKISHPDIDRLSTTFARLKKKVKTVKEETHKFPCQNCSLKFRLKTELRAHMGVHMHSVPQVEAREVDASQLAVRGPGVKGEFQLSIKP
ncbi:NACHT domain-containing protein [Cercophora samala]|uniref:NACHT domain-containing protein n=1 Tax=Cercophora samala TaxID=330535 RepID=A0AA39Z7A0_9PEZI|nr:NACHT domain-containing protein [Cercophora samala]